MGDLGSLETGAGQIYLAKFKGQVPHVNRDLTEAETLVDTLEAFRKEHESNGELLAQLNNKVKVCPNCGKGCGYTLAECNSCKTSLEEVGVSFTDNVFMGFVYGIAKGKFPYKVSIRKQTLEFLCFDDPLSMSPVHLNVIPTTVHCPDVRYLFTNPTEGLKLVDNMLDISTQAALESFWSDDTFRKKFFNDDEKPTSKEEMADIVCAGMNFPPSIYQLHLQFIHPPLLPMHYAMALDGIHFSYKRFFPLSYLVNALKLGVKAKMDIMDDTSIDEVISRLSKLGVSYAEHHTTFMRKMRDSQHRYAKWATGDFEQLVINGKPFCVESMTLLKDVDPKAVQKEDEKALQNYGRPYVDNKPTGSYYKYAKKPGDVSVFPLVSVASRPASLDLSALVGTALRAEHQGILYAAEVVLVSTSKRRAAAPIKVHYKGYGDDSDEWVAPGRLRSKLLKSPVEDGKARPKTKKVSCSLTGDIS